MTMWDGHVLKKLFPSGEKAKDCEDLLRACLQGESSDSSAEKLLNILLEYSDEIEITMNREDRLLTLDISLKDSLYCYEGSPGTDTFWSELNQVIDRFGAGDFKSGDLKREQGLRTIEQQQLADAFVVERLLQDLSTFDTGKNPKMDPWTVALIVDLDFKLSGTFLISQKKFTGFIERGLLNIEPVKNGSPEWEIGTVIQWLES